MMIGPDRTNMSQYCNGAQSPTRKMSSPATSNRIAKNRKRKQRPTFSLQPISEISGEESEATDVAPADEVKYE